MLLVSLHSKLHVLFALLALIGGSAGAAIADVTIDACVARNSIHHPPLAADMQSLCGFSSSIGSLLGFSVSGFLVHHIGAQVYSVLSFGIFRSLICGIGRRAKELTISIMLNKSSSACPFLVVKG